MATGVVLAGVGLVALASPAHAVDSFDPKLCGINNAAPQTTQVAWQRERLRYDDAWRLATGRGVTVAVIDTGVSNINTAYFNANNVRVFNLAPIDDKEREERFVQCNHGTNVASLIVSREGIDSRTNFAGIAPGATVLAFRGLQQPTDKNNQAQPEPPDATIKAIDEAIKAKVRIINISQAMSGGTPAYKAAIARAITAGIVVVASAGNADQGLSGPAYPAAYPGVISVGASDPADNAAEISYLRTPVTVAAPGHGVIALAPSKPTAGQNQKSLVANQAFGPVSGTSFAAPIVSGVVALLLEREPGLTPAQVAQRLVETADRPVGGVPQPGIGYGIVNPVRALAGTPVPVSNKPVVQQHETLPQAPPPPVVDPRPRQITLAIGAGAGAITLVALTLKLVLPAAARRDYASAPPPSDED